MLKNYTSEKHTQILIALLKVHGVRKIVASPGATNICLVASLQSDPFFEIYSSVDERSAAYIACGMAAESGEPVALSCTGSTASRNYIPGLTEAYYRKLPVLAITASQHFGRVGNYNGQVIDRNVQLNDIAMYSAQIDCVYTEEDEWACELEINKALLALRKNGGGPAHINLRTTYSKDFGVEELPKVKVIEHIEVSQDMPSLEEYQRIAVLVGAHCRWTDELLQQVDVFCEKYNAAVLHNHASNYKGKYGVGHAVIINMAMYNTPLTNADLVIYIGSVSRYPSAMKKSVMWRINPDGQIRDCEKTLTKVFQMSEIEFFQYYNELKNTSAHISEYASEWQREYQNIISQTPELPFSNTWVAQNTIGKLPENSVLHIAGSNTARAWNFFELPRTVECYSNDGAMGIDGQVSALVGESLASPNRLHLGVVGDLTFFYDMNCLGNRHIGNNFRLMVINNGIGAEFKIYTHPAYAFGEEANSYMAACGHFGDKSNELLCHYAEDLGYEYLTASTKEEYLEVMCRFLDPSLTENPIIFEVFTDSKDENDAIYLMNHIVKSADKVAVNMAKGFVKKIAGEEGINKIKKLMKDK